VSLHKKTGSNTKKPEITGSMISIDLPGNGLDGEDPAWLSETVHGAQYHP
jgi:hypothetical protein